MTDKQIAGMKKEFHEYIFWKVDINKEEADKVWQWIEELIKEVEGKGILIGEPFRETKKEHKHNWVMISHESFPFPQFTCPDCKIPDWIYEGREAIGA